MNVITKNYIEGLHCWKDAPNHLDYLRNKHRHIFHVHCYWEVKHNDREIEIIETQKEVDNYFKKYYSNKYNMCDFENMSCEDICNELLGCYKEKGLKQVLVLEDGQGGAECQV
mgnify:FL=1